MRLYSASTPSLLCDLDDTLIDRAGAFDDWAVRFAARNGLGEEDSRFLRWLDRDRQNRHRPRDEFFTMARDALNLVPGAHELMSEYLDEMAQLARPARGVRAVLRRATAQGWPIAVVTNGDDRQRRKLGAARLTSLVNVVVISGEVGLAKPDPEILCYAAGRLGGDCGRTWVVGDHPVNDIQAGHDAGMLTAWVSLGRTWVGQSSAPSVVSATAAGAIRAVLQRPSEPS